MSYVLLLVGLLFGLLARSAVRRPRGHRPLWVTAMVGSELGAVFGAAVVGLLVGFRSLGWAGGPAGAAGQALLGLALVGFTVALVRGWRSRGVMRNGVAEFTGVDVRLSSPGIKSLVAPFPRRRFLADEELSYGPHARHVVDRLAAGSENRIGPALVYVHGGGWWRGRRHTQARPMLNGLVESGWRVFTPSYRLSPEATFPDPVVDIKRLVAWVRANAWSLGVDPGFIAAAGGSTGGNIAALAALTSGDPVLQPGFEEADTSIQACIPLYGVHDMLTSTGTPLWPYLATSVMKSQPETDPDAWRRASPALMATDDRPPFFVVHGACDTLVSPATSRRLVTALRTAGGPAVGHVEVPWANHGFDFFAGPRGRLNAAAVVAVLTHLHAEHRQRAGG